MTVMDIAIHGAFRPDADPGASLASYRDILGFKVRDDVGFGGMRWITAGPAGQPGTPIALEPPAAGPAGCRLGVPSLDSAPSRSS
jgi:hypothetical protein